MHTLQVEIGQLQNQVGLAYIESLPEYLETRRGLLQIDREASSYCQKKQSSPPVNHSLDSNTKTYQHRLGVLSFYILDVAAGLLKLIGKLGPTDFEGGVEYSGQLHAAV